MSIEERIESYLDNGGLFNPEHMDHVKVGQLILDIWDELYALRLKIPKPPRTPKQRRAANKTKP